jgi:hypothetical protein
MDHGFVCDPNKSVSYNAMIVLGNMDVWLYFSRPTNLAFHNLCQENILLPPGIRSLLGLGLNFCPNPTTSTAASKVDLSRFKRDAFTRLFFTGSPPLPDTKLFIRSDWAPNDNENQN